MYLFFTCIVVVVSLQGKKKKKEKKVEKIKEGEKKPSFLPWSNLSK